MKTRSPIVTALIVTLLLVGCFKLRAGPACPENTTDPMCLEIASARNDGGQRDGSRDSTDVPQTTSPPGTDAGGPNPPAGPPATDPECQPGFHECYGECKSSLSPSHCGFACDPCVGIKGGEATCDGTRCGIACPAGKKACPALGECIGLDDPCGDTCPAGKNLCGNTCVVATDKTACGPSCSVCPTSPNGETRCDGAECSLTCNPGFHRCGDHCVSDESPASCGTSCSPCPAPQGGGAECKAGVCQPTCPAGTTVCKTTSTCAPAGTPCNGDCPAGRHECNNLCVDDTSPNSCGRLCAPCPAPANGEATCENAACASKCTAGFHKCGNECKPDNSPRSCGTSCSPCAVPANGSAACQNGSCSIRCNEGFHACGDQCRANTDPTACGSACRMCEAPTGGRAVCTNGNCDFECTNGRKCNGQCLSSGIPCNGTCLSDERLCGGKCLAPSAIPAENCGNGQDDDCDGQIDCADSNCGNGTACGGDRICQTGRCVTPCASGGVCQGNPGADRCIPGVFACDPNGTRACVDDRNGPACNGGQVCRNLSCVACGGINQPCCSNDNCGGNICRNGTCAAPCVSGGDCADNPGRRQCVAGTYRCDDAGVRRCVDGNRSFCSASQMCNGNGSCVARCMEGGSCTPTDRCKTGRYVCDNGQRRCMVTGDKNCGTRECRNGQCVDPCMPDVFCYPSGNRCLEGATQCGPNGETRCVQTATVKCAEPGYVCRNGNCVPP